MKTTILKAVALGAAAALALAGCSSASPDPSASASTGAIAGTDGTEALKSVTWTDNGEGVAPTLTYDAPFLISSNGSLLVSDGDGDSISDGQSVTVSYTVNDGTDGTVVYSTYDDASSDTIGVTTAQVDPTLYEVLTSAHVGAKILYATLDSSSVDEAGNPATVIMAVTVTGVFTPLERAEGTAVAPVDGLPTVTLADTGAPSVTIPAGDAPTELVAQLLIEGEGNVVEEGQSATVHYTGWLWDGTEFDSSWDGAPVPLTLDAQHVIDGWVQGLVGQKVGSQVLLVIPPDLGYGDAAQGSIPANSTLVFVVDILGAA